MDDIPRILRRAVGSFDPDADDGFARTVLRRRRQLWIRQLLTAVLAIAVSGALFGSLWAVYRPGGSSQPAAPTPGPTISPGPSREPMVPPLGRAVCGHGAGKICSGRSGPVVVLATGKYEGQSWTLSAFRSVYEGPEHTFRKDSPRVVRGAICVNLSLSPSENQCEGSSDPGTYWVFVISDLKDYDTPLPADPGDDPFAAGRGETFVGYSEDFGWRLGTTPAETERIDGRLHDGTAVEVRLIPGNPAQLGTTAEWWIVFFPRNSEVVSLAAVSEEDRVIWRYQAPPSIYVDLGTKGPGIISAASASSCFWTQDLATAQTGVCPPPDISCPPNCLYKLGDPERIRFQARPKEDARFIGWSGACAGQDPNCTLSVTEDMEISAIFERKT